MKEWLRILPLFFLFFGVLMFLDHTRWGYNLIFSALIVGIGCVGQFLIHRNVLNEEEADGDSDGCINCGRN